MDCSIMPLKKIKDYYLISTIDFFYPLVEDPYAQGRIGCANVLSDMYSMGIDEVDNMLMVLGASRNMIEADRFICTKEMMRGFNDLAAEGETEVTGGQSVMNPWPIIGGVALAVCHKDDFINPNGLQVGNVMVLTKPLGTQVAVNLKQAYREKKDCRPLYERTKTKLTQEDVDAAFQLASDSMGHLSRRGAKLMRKHNSTGATDITGFGMLGHASNLAVAQLAAVDIVIHTLPVIKGMVAVDEMVDGRFKLLKGYSAETSGGLFVALPSMDAAKAFIADLAAEDKTQGWIIGDVVERKSEFGTGIITDDVKVLEVDRFYL
eukprot:TRINITY_DN38177_c0_g1_i1.p1 TRINITY_DN38177_c0_g1~~TRINITY_DN38177_c0_g1_i1.p1  ORF type:complete len:320 (+),score=106.27 TRINITY_DN38177_c0_g1_i1:208-1167(+)